MINYLKLIFSEGKLKIIKRVKKADGIKKPLEWHNSFLQKNFNGRIPRTTGDQEGPKASELQLAPGIGK